MTNTNNITRYFQKIQLNAQYGQHLEPLTTETNQLNHCDFSSQYPSNPSKPLQKRIKKGI